MELAVVAIVVLLLSHANCIKHALFEKKYVGYRMGKKTLASNSPVRSPIHCSVICSTFELCKGFNFIRGKSNSNERKLCEFIENVPNSSQDSDLQLNPFSEIYKLNTLKPYEGNTLLQPHNVCMEHHNPCPHDWHCFEISSQPRCLKVSANPAAYSEAENFCYGNDGVLLTEEDTDVLEYMVTKAEFADFKDVWILSDDSSDIETTAKGVTTVTSDSSQKTITSKPAKPASCDNNKNKCKDKGKKDKKEKKDKKDKSNNSKDDDSENEGNGNKENRGKRKSDGNYKDEKEGNCRAISAKSHMLIQMNCSNANSYICEFVF